jgi:hypothetical protein
MQIVLPPTTEGYQQFLRIKQLPRYTFTGRLAWFPDEYASRIGIKQGAKRKQKYTAPSWMMDYQRGISELAIRKQKYCVFADCGMGKTPIMLEHARYAHKETGKPGLIVSPLMVIKQTVSEAAKFYGTKYKLEQVSAKDLPSFLAKGAGIGITNYEAIKDELDASRLGCLSLDESSLLKSHYGKWGTKLIEMGKGIPYKLACTGTPAPNDRIEYANHAVFMDAFPTVNSFLAKFFINRGETSERWELKAHAVKAFYLALSDWSIFLVNPSTYGWKDNTKQLPPIIVSVEDVGLTDDQTTIAKGYNKSLFAGMETGGIVSRSRMGQLAKGKYNGKRIDTLKPDYIAELCSRFEDESCIIWCKYNDEQDRIAELLPDAGNIDGSTPVEERQEIVENFQAGRLKTLISKPKIMGFGLNLQACTRMIFSGLHDSYEEYYQAVKRANRYGSTLPLHVHIPVTELERPMVDNVLRKATNVQKDTEQQERIFKELGHEIA